MYPEQNILKLAIALLTHTPPVENLSQIVCRGRIKFKGSRTGHFVKVSL